MRPHARRAPGHRGQAVFHPCVHAALIQVTPLPAADARQT
ncbi:hypothetical protein SXCC_04472 [Gluconacetobacter sp. SXCC-1]|nr:hypothetical protein SXCC_04472 [Gluconacetobacter sp. SXCC-1]